MGMLDRYTKAGGFIQLLSLIESFDLTKREKFLSLIEQENTIWAHALKERALSIERILAWPPAVLSEVVGLVNLKHLAIAMHGLTPTDLERLLSGVPHSERRRLENESGSIKPTPADIATTHAKIVETVRQMILKGDLRIEKHDPSVLLDEKTEEHLIQVAHAPKSSGHSHAQTHSQPQDRTSPTAHEAEDPARRLSADAKTLQASVVILQKENKALKAEVRLLKDKLEQIRKIA